VATWRNSLDPLHPLLLPWGNADVWAYSAWATNPFTAEQFGALAGVDPSQLVIWPSGKVVDSSSVVMSQNRGFTRMIVFDDQFTGGLNRTASTVLADAVTPGSTMDIQRAARDIRALVAGGDSIALPADPTQVDPDRASSIISALLTQGTRGGTVPPKMVLSGLTPRNEIAAPDRLVEVMNAYAVDEERVGRITDDVPTFMMNRLRALTAVTAQLGKSGFNAAASEFESDSMWMSDLVSISLATEYTVLSNTAEIPVTVSNESSAAVTVTVSVRSTSAIVQVAEPRQTITIEPKSNSRIMVPMTAVANGRTTLVAQLFDANTTTIGSAVAFPIEVQAQWEIVTVIVFFGSVSIIMTIGIIRTIRRRRAAAA
ncbi:MAG: hypothetical protein RLZZ40_1082, partial [Actinomycetota bacterium]